MSSAAVTGTTAIGHGDQSPAPAKDWREDWVAPQIMICLGGRAAELRARRPDSDGWCRRMDKRERVADHEAGHLLLAVATNQGQNGAAIEMVEGGCRGIAQHYAGAPPDLDHPTFERFDELRRDFVKATDYAKLAVGLHGWLKYLRVLWLRTDEILAAHWLAVRMLSQELQRSGVVRRNRAQQIIDRWYGVPGNSLVEAIRRTLPQHHDDSAVAATDEADPSSRFSI